MSDDIDEFFDIVGTKTEEVRCCRCRVKLELVYSIDTAWEGGTRYDYCRNCHIELVRSGDQCVPRDDWFIWMVASGPKKNLPVSRNDFDPNKQCWLCWKKLVTMVHWRKVRNKIERYCDKCYKSMKHSGQWGNCTYHSWQRPALYTNGERIFRHD